MYAEFYGLTAQPFQLTPDARFFFESTVHRQAMAYLVYGLHHAEGFIIITGEVGAGKTILVENLLSTIDRSSFITAKIVTTQLAGDDLLHLVAAGFGIAKEGLAKGPLLQRISDFALAQHRNGKRVLLIVDEAQNLSFEALEELRMLSNIFFDRTMALQSFLLGQPQFRATLGSPRLEQLRQRVTAAYHLGPLGEGESRAYVEHRLRRADWKGDPHFSEDCFPLIHQRTGGVPRQINTLCSRLLLFGFLGELHTLTAHAVEKVANDLREEIALVTAPSAVAESPAELVGREEALSQLTRRLGVLEDSVHRHGRVIKRAIEIAASYLQGERP
ncbi:MAG: AAA family ATPase [Alphaproteobacteria bacterium]|nr:AAA family ATPase [Alphaproteobacteria bacterium]